MLSRLQGQSTREAVLEKVCFAPPLEVPSVNVLDSEKRFEASKAIQLAKAALKATVARR